MKKQIIKMVLLLVLFFVSSNVTFAADVNLTIRDGNNIIFENSVPLPEPGTIELQGHQVDTQSVLSVLNNADLSSENFAITDLQYYESFGSFYVKCINDKCDNWQYVIDDTYPFASVDQNILSGGENVYMYFGPQNKITLSSDNITANEILTVTAQKYDYENDAWIIRTGVTAGLTQPNPEDPFSPTEIQTGAVDENGQAVFSSIPVGSYNVGVKEDFYFPTEVLTVTTPPEPPSHPSSSGSGGFYIPLPTTKITFDTNKAFAFLIAQQKENGSFGEDLYTDWVALALGSESYQSEVTKLIKYFEESKIENALLTDYERHAMALMALGLNPYNINNENYIEKITAGFDGKQFGNINEDNDDIFALIVLQNAGYKQEEKMISNDISFILSRQEGNGSWDGSVDMTGASMEALSAFSQNEQVKNALVKAKEFLKQNQKDNGSWNNNASSTAWAIEGILAMSEKVEDWKKSENTPLDYFATLQDEDGGIKNENIQNKIWESAYVATALSGKTWNQLMQKFEKPKTIVEKPKTVVIAKTIKKQEIKQRPTQTITATAINAISPSPVPIKIETQKKNWFIRLLENIFSIF